MLCLHFVTYFRFVSEFMGKVVNRFSQWFTTTHPETLKC